MKKHICGLINSFFILPLMYIFFTAAVPACAEPEVGETGAAELEAVCDRYREDIDYLENWLENAPPPGEKQAEREAALKHVDRILYIEEASKLPCVGEFFHSRMDRFMEDFELMDPGDDAIVWKLYNHTEIVQTKDIAVIIDLTKGFDRIEWDDGQIARLVELTDVLLITHSHADHADRRVFDMYLDAGRPIVVPEIFWPDYERNDELTVIRKGTLNFPGIRVHVFPSEQKQTLNNIYLIETKGGTTVMHLGDNNNIFKAGNEWFRNFREPVSIDVLIPNIWSPDLVSLLKYVRPGLVIPSHEHEIGHPPSGRRTYDYVYKILRTLNEPYAVPAWGEYVRIEQ